MLLIKMIFFASKKFAEAELNFEEIDLAAKSAIMSSFSLYGINFYDEALESLQRYLKTYPADKNVIYAHYLIAIIYFEQISDERKDLKPLLEADKRIDSFLKKYPDTDYGMDLRFKRSNSKSIGSKRIIYCKILYFNSKMGTSN